ncbi:MAG: hypothetical protein HYV03_00350 [Deltaproteobacteria bacterium]|nr:hypothetical protein [Deltaproteobacteria bacterium]
MKWSESAKWVGSFRCLALAGMAVCAQASPIQDAGKIDAGGSIARVTVTNDGRLIAWNKRGEVLPGWPVVLPDPKARFILSPRLTDTDFDQQEEILAVSQVEGKDPVFHVYKGTGAEKLNWQFTLPTDGSALVETPRLVDLDGDNLWELAYGLKNGAVKLFHRDFSQFDKFAETQLDGPPVLLTGDPDNDGRSYRHHTGGDIHLVHAGPAVHL